MSTTSEPVALSARVEDAGVPWDQGSWRSFYRSAPAEDSYSLEVPALPADLVGTFFRNVPAKFEVGDTQVVHPFDADGMLAALTFDGSGNVYFRNRFVRTRGFVREQMEGRSLYAGMFGNPKPFWNNGLTPKNLANTNVLWWGGRLLALWEGGRPHLMDPLSLATSRESDLAGLLKPGETFSAHPRFDRARKRLVNFAYSPNPLTGTKLTFFEFGENFRPVDIDKPRLERTIPGFLLVHDFAITANYYVVSAAPTNLGGNPIDLLLGKKAVGEAIEFDEKKPTFLWLIPRDGSEPISFEVETHFCFHHANAYEDAQGRVCLDSCRSPKLELGGTSGKEVAKKAWEMEYATLPVPSLWRYTLDVRAKTASSQHIFKRYVDFPSVDPRRAARAHRFVYAATGSEGGLVAAPAKGVVKIDTSETADHQIWLTPGPTQFAGEPLFVPRAGAAADSAEDDGYVLLPIIDGERGGLATVHVLRADRLSDGPIASVELETFLPHGLHGTFVEELVPKKEEIEQATTLMKMYARKSREWNKVDGSFAGFGIASLFQKGVDGR